MAYSDVRKADLRWIDVVMVLLVMIWAGAVSLADENLAGWHFAPGGVVCANGMLLVVTQHLFPIASLSHFMRRTNLTQMPAPR
jgi:hypothetical protein